MKLYKFVDNTPHDHKLSRSTGSKTSWSGDEELTRDMLAFLDWEEVLEKDLPEGVYHPEGICRYFHTFDFPGRGFEGVMSLKEFRRIFPQSKPEIVEGNHGLEIVSKDIPPQPTRTLKLIVGPGEGPTKFWGHVWTWYPGNFTRWTPPIKEGDTVDNLPDYYTVKLSG